jgi:hypothetical protein
LHFVQAMVKLINLDFKHANCIKPQAVFLVMCDPSMNEL